MNAHPSTSLESHLGALRASVPPAAAAGLAHIATTTPRPRLRKLVVGAATACALVVLASCPLFAAPELVAFDDVQRHFREFTTLVMTIETTVGGEAMPRHTVTATRDGGVRVDIGPHYSAVSDTRAGRGVGLLHDERAATPFAFAPGGRGNDWLDRLGELGAFTGRVDRIPGTRTIAGHAAHGFALTHSDQRTEIWANADGLPLTMQISGGVDIEMVHAFAFVFDAPVDAVLLSLEPPAGYASKPEAD